MKAIIAKVRPDSILKPLVKELDKASKRALEKLEKTTIHFQQVTPTFLMEESQKGGHLIRVVGPADDKSGLIWFFLDKGTSVRYAVMDSTFVPKTTPNTLTTTIGVGGLSHFDFDNPRPGIEARMWTELISKVETKRFQEDSFKKIKQAKVFSN